jgi:CRP/FNR family cyclic AMP-dependent transcriptional regulator
MRSVLDHCDPDRLKQFGPGTVLLTEGETSGRLYILADGAIEVLRGETQVVMISEPGAFFGEMSVLLGLPHTASVRAHSLVSVYAYDDATAFLRSDPGIAFMVARLLAQRLNAATTYLVDLKHQFEGSGNHLVMVSDVLASLLHQQELREVEFTGSDNALDPRL